MSKWTKWAGCLAALWLIAAAGVAGAGASDRQPAGGELQSTQGLREIAGRSHLLSLDAGVPGLTDVPRYEAVALRQVYPRVDLIFYGNQGRLEYDFELAPGVDPGRIRHAGHSRRTDVVADHARHHR